MSDTDKNNTHTKVLIIGSGPAGYTAAIYAARANLKPIQFLGIQPGGQLTITTEVENYPGFADPIQGPWLMEQMRTQAENVGTVTIQDNIVDVDFSSHPFKATDDSGTTYTGDTVIITTGAKARWLGLESEQKFQNMGVSACATCDGFFFKNKKVAVVGGGNSAVEEALFLANMCEKVTLIHRRNELRAERIMQDRLFKHPKIDVKWDREVDEILGVEIGQGDNPGVTGVRLKSTKDGSLEEIDLDGIFIAIGHDPATELFKGKLDMDKEGYLITAPDSTATNIPGVYAAGDVKDKTYRQAVTAAGMGCMAALEADKFIATLEANQNNEEAA
ncbi:MAG: thioredoxin-disulfide reductase [Alphaproteobacteria bacterium]|nr:thioredoxin-disulfide reductase [Alphaproteobacteria bacterium]NCQ87708.1 thioredoxin-disulfide reductase [Alphaproteobacteria bacterium]NCT05783.1 thioredoxin-disulfide reductase [Alphaproteobacteria bacterium]